MLTGVVADLLRLFREEQWKGIKYNQQVIVFCICDPPGALLSAVGELERMPAALLREPLRLGSIK